MIRCIRTSNMEGFGLQSGPRFSGGAIFFGGGDGEPCFDSEVVARNTFLYMSSVKVRAGCSKVKVLPV